MVWILAILATILPTVALAQGGVACGDSWMTFIVLKGGDFRDRATLSVRKEDVVRVSYAWEGDSSYLVLKNLPGDSLGTHVAYIASDVYLDIVQCLHRD